MRAPARWIVVTAVVLGGLGPVAPAQAGAKAVVIAHVTPATAYISTPVVISGTVRPVVKGNVTLLRLSGKRWVTVSHVSLHAGTYAFTVRQPRTAVVQVYRVVRGATLSNKLTVRVTKARYGVKPATSALTVGDGRPIALTGTVKPKTTGGVQLQQLVGTVWTTVAKAKLTKASTYSFALARPAGSYRLRVVKSFSAKVATGVGPARTYTVLTAPATSTVSLARASVGRAYSATLAASGGLAPYTWSLASGTLPAGLTLTAAALLAGTPTAAMRTMLTFAVTDALGQRAQLSLMLVVTPAYGPAVSWGNNISGGLGDGTTTNRGTAVSVASVGTAVSVAASGGSGYAVLADGTLWDWGLNDSGQLGDGTTKDHPLPEQVAGLSDVVAVSPYASGGYALTGDGSVFSWGDSTFGQLGTGTTTASLTPVRITTLSGVKAIGSGAANGYALMTDGTVRSWGSGTDGALGTGSMGDSKLPVAVPGLTDIVSLGTTKNSTAYAVTSTGRVEAWGGNGSGELGNGSPEILSGGPVQVSGLTGVVAVAGSFKDGYALTSEGRVWAWGDNYFGQLATGGGNRNEPFEVAAPVVGAVSIAAGYYSAYAALADGTVRGWGYNFDADLGDGGAAGTTSINPVTATGVSGVTSVAGLEHGAIALKAAAG